MRRITDILRRFNPQQQQPPRQPEPQKFAVEVKMSQPQPNPGNTTKLATEKEIKSKKRSGLAFIILAFLLMLYDYSIGYKGFVITELDSFLSAASKIILSLGYVIVVGVFFYFFTSKERDVRALISWTAVVILVAVSFGMGFGFDNVPVIHMIFIIFFWFFYIKGAEEATTANILLIALLIFDLYLYSFLSLFDAAEALKFSTLPFLFFLIVAIVYKESKSTVALLSMIAIILWYFFTSTPAYGQVQGAVQERGFQSPIEIIYGIANQFSLGFDKFTTGANKWISGRIQYAITGKVEKNQYEQLGVYLEGVRAADPKYYENEPIVIWGRVKARTLDDPINIQVGCYSQEGTTKKYADRRDVDPKDKFPVFKLQEQDFACTLRNVKSGTSTIKAYADFNFETLAYLKVYFMDRDRLFAMTRENLDPFEEFGIKDKKPVSIFTNGPAKIGMETTNPLIGVGSGYVVSPRLSLSIENREGWEGKIRDIKELVLLLPKGVTITNPQADPQVDQQAGCNVRFTEYNIQSCQDSCNLLVNKECLDVCENYKDPNEKSSCQKYCDDSRNKCNEQCEFLFNDEGESYTGYALVPEELDKLRKQYREEDYYEKFKFFSCRINPNSKEVLENTPITTKTFRVKVRYNYTLEKPVSVRIERDPSLDRETKIGDVGLTVQDYSIGLIRTIAGGQGVDENLALAIASVESSFKHCCKEPGKNKASSCIAVNDNVCGTDKIITNSDGSSLSIGMMQININYWTQYAQSTSDYGCNGKNAYDLECNIKIGVGILKANINTCGDAWKAVGSYNTGNCNKGQPYIDRVKKAYDEIKSGKLLSTSSASTIITPPTNLRGYKADNKIILSWDLSTDDGTGTNSVIRYDVYRSGDTTAPPQFIGASKSGQNTFTDDKIKPFINYNYIVKAVDSNGKTADSNVAEILYDRT